MRKRRLGVALGGLVLAFSVWLSIGTLLGAEAVLPPRPGLWQLIKFALSSQHFQIAVPHRSILQQLRFSVVPVVSACGTQDCDMTTAQPHCPTGCPQGFCYCPDCSMRVLSRFL
jgi:hypothetical protein